MSNLRCRLLTTFFVVLGGLSGCTAGQGLNPQPSSSQVGNLTVNLENGVAQTDNWRASVLNCSTESFNCLKIVGRLDLAFPKRCSEFNGQTQWSSPIGQFRVVAPEVHYGLPYGSYISTNYPNVILFYRYNVGFSEIRVTATTPYEETFDPNDVLQAYNLEILGHRDFFRCAD